MLLTVFTATKNRAYILPRLFESLMLQKNKNFEWIIVDDNSSDNTDECIDNFRKSDLEFKIKYYKNVKGGGKHRAMNLAISKAEGVLFFSVDSDDYLVDNAIMMIEQEWKKVDREVMGICFRRINQDTGNLIGEKKFRGGYASPIKINYLWNMRFDKAEIFRTDVICKQPFPEFEGEWFCTEAYWIYLIEKNGPAEMACCNVGIRYTEYLYDGLTKNMKAIKTQNPKGYLAFYKLLLTFPEVYLHPKHAAYAFWQIIYLSYIIRMNYRRKMIVSGKDE